MAAEGRGRRFRVVSHTCRTAAVSRQADRRDGPLHGPGRSPGRRRRRSFPRVRRVSERRTRQEIGYLVEAGMSMDQIAARAFERETQLSSLQLQMDENSIIGSCDVGYSCAYSSTISWLTPTLPLMAENNPRVVFERLFGASDSTDPK